MMAELFALEPTEPKAPGKRTYAARGFAARPGSGPAGETCRSCDHSTRVQAGNHVVWKCALGRASWTKSPKTDIRINAEACELWEKDKALGGGVTCDQR